MLLMAQDHHDSDIDNTERPLKERITGLGQKIIGEIEEVGGALTGDPITQAEGQLNVDIGEMREGVYDTGDDAERHRV